MVNSLKGPKIDTVSPQYAEMSIDTESKFIEVDRILAADERRLGAEVDDSALYEALECGGDGPGLKNIGKDQKLTVIVSDNTRRLPLGRMVRALLDTIGSHRRQNVRFLIATGTHKETDPATLELGDDIVRGYRFYNHNSRDYDNMILVGEVSPKTNLFGYELKDVFLKTFYELAREPDRHIFTEEHMRQPEKVLVHRAVVETDVVVLAGGIQPHYFAGFSGGAKSLVPGCVGREFILRNHFYKMHPSARLANMTGNVVRDELEEAASLCRNIINYNVVVGPDGRVLDVVAGDVIKSHRKGAAVCYDRLKVKTQKYDLVLATDTRPVTMSQKQIKKVAAAACRVVKEDGVIIIFGDCKERLGSDSRLNDEVFKVYLERIKPAGVDVFINSSMKKSEVELAEIFRFLEAIEDGIEYAKDKLGPGISSCLMPSASAIIPEVVDE